MLKVYSEMGGLRKRNANTSTGFVLFKYTASCWLEAHFTSFFFFFLIVRPYVGHGRNPRFHGEYS